jgi:Putative restriction endonuclease
MAHAVQQRASLSIGTFRAWAESRPDEQHWELIDGVPTLRQPLTRAHQRIASNLERLLNDALVRVAPGRAAYQRVGLNLGPSWKIMIPNPTSSSSTWKKVPTSATPTGSI